jgi:hypothetical protein
MLIVARLRRLGFPYGRLMFDAKHRLCATNGGKTQNFYRFAGQFFSANRPESAMQKGSVIQIIYISLNISNLSRESAIFEPARITSTDS